MNIRLQKSDDHSRIVISSFLWRLRIFFRGLYSSLGFFWFLEPLIHELLYIKKFAFNSEIVEHWATPSPPHPHPPLSTLYAICGTIVTKCIFLCTWPSQMKHKFFWKNQLPQAEQPKCDCINAFLKSRSVAISLLDIRICKQAFKNFKQEFLEIVSMC